MKVLWSPEARQDLREIYLYLAAEDPDAARALHKRIKQGVQLLRDNPHIGRHGRVPGTRELVIIGTYYIVPYRIREKRLELLRVYHTACKWPEHFHQGGQQMHRWIQTEKARYYQALLVNDLFGEWTLVMAWGALGSKRGGMRSTRVPSYEAGLERNWEIAAASWVSEPTAGMKSEGFVSKGRALRAGSARACGSIALIRSRLSHKSRAFYRRCVRNEHG